jgi:hypothetical protein
MSEQLTHLSAATTLVVGALLLWLGYHDGAPVRHILGVLAAAAVSALGGAVAAVGEARLGRRTGAVVALALGLAWCEGALLHRLLPSGAHMSGFVGALLRALTLIVRVRR